MLQCADRPFRFRRPFRFTAEVLVSIPHREALLLFGNHSNEYVEQMKDIIRAKESGNPRPLTFELFRLKNGELSTYN